MPVSGAPSWRSEWLWPALVFLFVALLSRAAVFGNPVVHIDEQFYLLVGDRMLHGALPYIDIWDRKPIGLFLIYAAIRLLGGEGILHYQIVASLFAAATALVVYRIARRISPPLGAGIAGVSYLLFLVTFNGFGGQSPVFYNLPVALAALASMRVVTRPNVGGLWLKGAGVMLLLGAAIQIKYTVVFEGIFFGLALLWREWRDRGNMLRLVGAATIWIGCALLPTAAVLGYYASLHQADAFVQANFLSIFGRHEPFEFALSRLATNMALLLPFGGAIFLVGKWYPDKEFIAYPNIVFVGSWAISALAGYLFFGTYYDHYTLPLLAPLAALAAPAFAQPDKIKGYGIAILLWGMISGAVMVCLSIKREGNKKEVEYLTSVVGSHLHGGCLYVYDGPPILYLKTNACFATRFVFPKHFSSLDENGALGVDTTDAVQDMLSRHPNVIVTGEADYPGYSNPYTRRLLMAVLKRDYRLVSRSRFGKSMLLIYARAVS